MELSQEKDWDQKGTGGVVSYRPGVVIYLGVSHK